MRAVDLDRARVELRGLAGDRRWLVVNAEGKFLTQRSHPQLATINADLLTGGLKLSSKGSSVEIERPDGAARRDIVVWDSKVNAALADPFGID